MLAFLFFNVEQFQIARKKSKFCEYIKTIWQNSRNMNRVNILENDVRKVKYQRKKEKFWKN